MDALTLEFSHGNLVRALPNFDPLEIAPREVTRIVESTRGITIETNSLFKVLFVDRGLADYDDFRSKLALWASQAHGPSSTPSILAVIKKVASYLVCVIFGAGPLYLMYTTETKLVLPLCIVLTAAFAAMIGYCQRSPYFPISLRRRAWILLAMPLLALIYRSF